MNCITSKPRQEHDRRWRSVEEAMPPRGLVVQGELADGSRIAVRLITHLVPETLERCWQVSPSQRTVPRLAWFLADGGGPLIGRLAVVRWRRLPIAAE